jgi:large subunit ribosomal protein L17
MRHRVAHRKLGRTTEHRIALLRNQAGALLRHERIETTVPKAKELRPFVERIITLAKRGIAAGEAGRLLHARRMVLEDIPDQEVVRKLFDTIAPRFAERPGGYTRILKIGYRRGDSAPLAQMELVGSEYNPKAAAEGDEKAAAARKSKGVGGRLRAAAARFKKKKDTGRGAEGRQQSED